MAETKKTDYEHITKIEHNNETNSIVTIDWITLDVDINSTVNAQNASDAVIHC